jgi:hypothetical protein
LTPVLVTQNIDAETIMCWKPPHSLRENLPAMDKVQSENKGKKMQIFAIQDSCIQT